MADLTNAPEQAHLDLRSEEIVRNLADFAVHINRRTLLGFFLQRSLIRYCFLRSIGLPVEVQFGASPADLERPLHLTSHAWLSLTANHIMGAERIGEDM